jgi:hypothetical protein
LNRKRFAPGAALWAVLALALILRLMVGVWWQSRLAPGERFEFGDSEAYWVLAQQIAHGEPYQYGSPDARVFRMPGYPALLAVLLRLFGDLMPVMYARAASAVFGTATVAAVYWLAALLYDRRTGLVAALAAACYPGAIAMSIVVLSEAPFCPLYLAQLAAWVKCWQSGEPRKSLIWAVISGLLGGLATLVRPDWLLFAPFAAVVGLVLIKIDTRTSSPGHRLGSAPATDVRRIFKHIAVMLLVLAAVMTPWWWRNARVVGHFVPTTLQVGASLYDGLNPKANGASEMSFVPGFIKEEQRHPSADDEAFEYRLDRRLWKAAWQWAIAHPSRVAKLAVWKLSRMWNVWPNDPRNRGGLVRLVTAITYVPAIVLALVGVWRTRGQAWPAALCWLPAVYLTLLHVVFVSSVRYREPPMLGLLIFTAAALTRGTRPSSAR